MAKPKRSTWKFGSTTGSASSTTTSLGRCSCRIRFGYQRIENEDPLSVIAHLYSTPAADRDHLPRGNDWHRAVRFSSAGERFADYSRRKTHRLRLARSEIRIAALLLAATLSQRLWNSPVRRKQ